MLLAWIFASLFNAIIIIGMIYLVTLLFTAKYAIKAEDGLTEPQTYLIITSCTILSSLLIGMMFGSKILVSTLAIIVILGSISTFVVLYN